MSLRKKSCFGIVFALLFFVSMIVLILIDNTMIRYDAAFYKRLEVEYANGGIDNLSTGFRGWLFPFILSIFYRIGMLVENEYLGDWLMASVFFAVTFSASFYYVSQMLEIEQSDKYAVCVGGGISGIIFFIFFRGLFIYPLSDFCAFSFALLDIILIHDIVKNERRQEKWKGVEAYIAGFCLYGVYNIRTIYLFLFMACLLLLTIWQLCEKKWKQLALTLPACLAGILSCAIPQIKLNYRLLGILSWKVPTEGLMLKQLQWGISWERYATYVGESAQYDSAAMYFVDKIGQNLLDSAGIVEFSSYRQFIKLVLSHPLDFLGVYVRHFLNMLYPIYPNQYIYDITKDKSLLLILFYTLCFVAVSAFLYSFKPKRDRWLWLGMILLPCFCILPGAVEIRFFIALHFVIYMYAILGFKDFIVRFWTNRGKYIAAYLVGFALYIAYAGSMLGTTANGIATIN